MSCSAALPAAKSLVVAATAAVHEKVITFLAAFFVDGAADPVDARQTANALLASYGARTGRELRHAGLSIAFSFGTLDALSRSASSELSVSQVVRLRSNANALNRAALQNDDRLERLLQQPPIEPAPLTEAPEAIEAVSPTLSPPTPPRMPPSRQQRRAEARQAEKQRRQKQQQMRLAARAARRAAPPIPAPHQAEESAIAEGVTDVSLPCAIR